MTVVLKFVFLILAPFVLPAFVIFTFKSRRWINWKEQYFLLTIYIFSITSLYALGILLQLAINSYYSGTFNLYVQIMRNASLEKLGAGVFYTAVCTALLSSVVIFFVKPRLFQQVAAGASSITLLTILYSVIFKESALRELSSSIVSLDLICLIVGSVVGSLLALIVFNELRIAKWFQTAANQHSLALFAGIFLVFATISGGAYFLFIFPLQKQVTITIKHWGSLKATAYSPLPIYTLGPNRKRYFSITQPMVGDWTVNILSKPWDTDSYQLVLNVLRTPNRLNASDNTRQEPHHLPEPARSVDSPFLIKVIPFRNCSRRQLAKFSEELWSDKKIWASGTDRTHFARLSFLFRRAAAFVPSNRGVLQLSAWKRSEISIDRYSHSLGLSSGIPSTYGMIGMVTSEGKGVFVISGEPPNGEVRLRGVTLDNSALPPTNRVFKKAISCGPSTSTSPPGPLPEIPYLIRFTNYPMSGYLIAFTSSWDSSRRNSAKLKKSGKFNLWLMAKIPSYGGPFILVNTDAANSYYVTGKFIASRIRVWKVFGNPIIISGEFGSTRIDAKNVSLVDLSGGWVDVYSPVDSPGVLQITGFAGALELDDRDGLKKTYSWSLFDDLVTVLGLAAIVSSLFAILAVVIGYYVKRKKPYW